ncbi:MAG: zinc-binding alcohol dehydrogenase family protein [Gemmatimonadales bacterium]|nr:zinc-binding alcohol dehydrogenase family protein [Gemmatimonadales bacterium]NIN11899.1 zinc-binding alcohol dehydrogenase family protein [Gemmatimonadales bacterium]NIN50449.1 zinc-binding alcohol dehydrogenase family protein [Gemmatimonadales bacterium]NIP07913.1 zinc-binding alcohol dehydrogenase family protein [Gemmatimonadales bacterium]NIR01937.1 zinc-binding alcohol dehydrogenase family protein [Gemmatimonadales bacterium]
MRAMLFEGKGRSLRETLIDRPSAGPGQLLLKVHCCAVCRTDLHVFDGELSKPKLPLVLGHEIVGTVEEVGQGANRFSVGDRVGVPWLGWTCGVCRYCRSGRENLCYQALFTGYNIDGGYAEYTVADHRFCLPIPDGYSDQQAAPLLCAGLIGYRSYKAAAEAERLGIYGFGAAAHIITQVARHQGRRVFAFTKPGDRDGQEFARQLGAEWAGSSEDAPPAQLDAAIIFAPVGSLVPAALRAVAKGGTVVCGGIHMSDIPSFPYELLWGERTICSVANLTRHDGEEFFQIAPQVPVRTEIQPYRLGDANRALKDLRDGNVRGAAVLVVSDL